ncbi:MAG: AAA family ATPase [Polyangiaceae bacterium]
MIELPRYTISEKIHEGAHACFYRGHRDADRLPVAIKVLKSEYPTITELARLRHEHSIMEELDLPGVPRVIALERHGQGLALITEDTGGESLDRTIRRRRLGLREVLEVGIRLSETLAALHRKHVIHKDIKPANTLFNAAERKVALIDFGIATRLSQETQQVKRFDSLEGTLAYMSPEQTGRMNRVVDHRSDLYSLGVTLYELLTGSLPFQGTEPMDLVHSHLARRPAPPRQVAPEVPEVVSSIVLRLLAKPAEDRYQHAAGLQADLEECLARLDSTGGVEPFELGKQDLGEELRIPQKLYGREKETAALLSAFERAAVGTARLLLVTGYAGVGKSVLVNEIHKALADKSGHFLSGKFDQLSRSVPYAPLVHAFRDLLRHVLAEPDTVREAQKAKLSTALGANASVLCEMLPELEQLLGPQPPVQPLGPTESQNRFTLVFQNFLRVFATAEHPLVLFLDDLQWSDPGSLKLLQVLLTDPESGYLLVVGAYRDNEVDTGHSLALALEEIKKTGAKVDVITLSPLSSSDVEQLIADALACDRSRSAPIAEHVYQRTQGNPFFVTQALSTLHREGQLRFDVASGAWQWDVAAVVAALSTDDVLDFMIARVERLEPRTRRALQLAACIGHRFRLRTLAAISEQSPGAVAEALWPSLREGLVLPLDTEYRFVHSRHVGGHAGGHEGGDEDGADFDVSYRFLHDRAQQAAYSLIALGDREGAHLRIGRLLKKGGDEDDLFEVVNHMNLGRARIDSAAERMELAQLNLVAGHRAKGATAYEAAAQYFATGMSLLEDAAWETNYDLCFALYRERAECEYLARRTETAAALFETLLARARTRLERAQIHDLHINLFTTLGHIADAQRIGRTALALFDIHLPEGNDAARLAAFQAELAQVSKNLGARRIEDLAEGAELVDPEPQIIQTLFGSLFPSSFLTSPLLYGFVIVRHVNLSLLHGQSPASALGYMSYGYLISGVLGQYQDARRFGELALKLNDRFANANMRAMLHFLFGAFAHFVMPLDGALAHFARGREAGFESGDFQYLSYTTYCTFTNRLGRGDSMPSVRAEVDGFFALMQRTKDQLSTLFLTVSRAVIANLEGRSSGRLDLSGEGFDEPAFSKMLADIGLVFVACYVSTYKAQIAFMRGEYRLALQHTDAALAVVGSAAGLYFTTELEYYACLTFAALWEEGTAEEREAWQKRYAEHHARIATWAGLTPTTFEQKRLVLDAELARMQGREVEAMGIYDQAIEQARESGFVRDEALANELCGRFHQARRRAKVARAYITDAYYGYLRWGVPTKLADLEVEFPYLRDKVAGFDHSPSSTGGTSSPRGGASALDMGTVLKAAQALSGELVLDRLLERLMRLVLENAGAQRAFFVLARDGQLRVEASVTVDPDLVRVGVGTPVGDVPDLAQSVIRQVVRDREPVVLGNAAKDERFGGDPHVQRAQVGSLACLPMMHQGRLAGVLYLENNLALDAFTPARNELLQALSSQAAVAIDNALLYADVRAAAAELKRANETLEQQVAARTQELSQAVGELWSEMDIARKIQTVLLPQRPALTGYEITAMMQPAAHVGGDYYDVFRAGEQEWVLVGDVSGHGVPAGLIMMMVQTAVRATVLALREVGERLSPSRLLSEANATLRTNLERMGRDQYMTISAFCFDGGTVRYSGLHEDIHVLRAATGEVETISTRGVWLGILDNIAEHLHDDTFTLAPGDALLLITDGVTEARRAGKMLGAVGLSEVFRTVAQHGASTAAIVDGINEELASFVKADDVTMLAIRRQQLARMADG